MDKLPQEILRPIVCEQSKEDLHSIRLVNSKLAAAAAPTLFETLHVWIGLESLEALTSLAEHPILSQYVKKIVLSPLRFIEQPDSQYESKVRKWLNPEPSERESPHVYRKIRAAQLSRSLQGLDPRSTTPNGQALALGKHMAVYSGYIAAQRYLSSNKLDLNILSQALAAFSQLDSVNVYSRSDIGSTQLIRDFGVVFPQDLVTCDCEYVLPLLFQALQMSNVGLRTFQLGQHERRWTDQPLFAGHVVGNFDKILAKAISHSFSEPDVYGCRNSLRDLSTLKIARIPNSVQEADDSVREATETRTVDGIRHLIAYAPLLESLQIGEIAHSAGGYRSFSSILGGLALEHLRVLDLTYLECRPRSLRDFLSLHATTLRQVHLNAIMLRGSWAEADTCDWPFLLKSLRKGGTFTKTQPVLTLFVIHCWETGPHKVQVQDYLIGKTDQNPLSRRQDCNQGKNGEVFPVEELLM